ncbi:MAG: SLBB domain-containing protein, partial [Solirubrobacterales bacterium]
MPEISPYRAAAFVAMVAVLLLVGWNSLRSGDAVDRGMPANGLASGASAPAEGSGKELTVSGESSGLRIGSSGRRIVVDVSGEVKRPGVYGFLYGQRVIDAIRRAGGITDDAWPSGINRAAVLEDGQQVVVPSRSVAAITPGGAVAPGAPGSVAADEPISLGSATQAQLEEI